jgi:hypothetical protein
MLRSTPEDAEFLRLVSLLLSLSSLPTAQLGSASFLGDCGTAEYTSVTPRNLDFLLLFNFVGLDGVSRRGLARKKGSAAPSSPI